jgi:hypothetical protein
LSPALLTVLPLPIPLLDSAPPAPVLLLLSPPVQVSASPLAVACLSDSEALQPVLVDPLLLAALVFPPAASRVHLPQALLDVEVPKVDLVSTLTKSYFDLLEL